VAARFVASLATAIAVGLLWNRLGRDAWIERDRHRPVEGETRWRSFTETAQHDFLHAGGWLVIGAMTAATLQVVVPRSVLDGVADHQVLAVVALAGLAVVLAVCSEADAFVAASLDQFSLTARLVFMVVGPVVDLKLVALQTGVFGRRFALRFAPLTLAVAIFFGCVVGWWLRRLGLCQGRPPAARATGGLAAGPAAAGPGADRPARSGRIRGQPAGSPTAAHHAGQPGRIGRGQRRLRPVPAAPTRAASPSEPDAGCRAADGDRMVEAATEARMLSPSTHRQNASPPAGY
jgi:Predicted permease